MLDTAFLQQLTEAPSVGTACGPVIHEMAAWFGSDYQQLLVPDGFTLFQKKEADPGQLKVVFISHLDEVGGCVFGPFARGGFSTRIWGNKADIYAGAELQGFDYLAKTARESFPVRAEMEMVGGESRIVLHGKDIKPYRTAFTFRQKTTLDGDTISGKALDPRVTAWAVAQAVRELDRPEVGALFVMAEECAMDVARKAVTYLQRNAPGVALVVNADVPEMANLGEAKLELPAIRIFEGHSFIDPSFGIQVSDLLHKRQIAHHLSSARSGSQTSLFTPIARTLSIALPSAGIHLPCYHMSLTGAENCVKLLKSIGLAELQGELPAQGVIG